MRNKLSISEDDAQDLFSQAKCKFIMKFIDDNLEPPDNPEGYLYKMAYNHYLDKKKKKDNQTDELDNYKVEQYLMDKEDHNENDPLIKAENEEELSADEKRRIEAILAAKKQTKSDCMKLIEARKFEQEPLDEMYERLSHKYKSKRVLSTRISQCWDKFCDRCNDIYNDSNDDHD